MSLREILLIVSVLFWVFCHFSVIQPLGKRNRQLESEIAAAPQELDQKQMLIDTLTIRYQKLQDNDPKEVERVLREKYKYCRDNETIVLFER